MCYLEFFYACSKVLKNILSTEPTRKHDNEKVENPSSSPENSDYDDFEFIDNTV
jgi:hypothetical protein